MAGATSIVTYDSLMREVMQKSNPEIEKELEEMNLIHFRMTYHEACNTLEKGKAGGMHRRIMNWVEGLDEPVKKSLMFFINLENACNSFMEDTTAKLKGKALDEWQRACDDEGFRADVRILMINTIYEHKAQNARLGMPYAFLSPKAHQEVALAMANKMNRSFIHEAVGRIGKTSLAGTLTDEHIHLFIEAAERSIYKAMSDSFRCSAPMLTAEQGGY